MKTLPRNEVLQGDAVAVLSRLLPESVDCVVTSPPYLGVRNYGDEQQIGQEPDIESYVAQLRPVLARLRHVLKPTGSLWLNLGDVYSRHRRQGVPAGGLLLAPERVALALSTTGWLVRNIVIWQKPNPLPQSARDRLSPTYEVVIFATRRRDYFFDLDAIRVPHRSEPGRQPREANRRYQGGNAGLGGLKAAGRVGHPNGKNPGDIWTISTATDRLGHQATFPEALIERPILATCPELICVQCDQAWTRPTRVLTVHSSEGARPVRKVGALRRCGCFAPARPGVVLDPFFGTGTVGVVAERLRRDWLGIELNPDFISLAEKRLHAARAA